MNLVLQYYATAGISQMMADDMEALRRLDRLITSSNATVKDLLDQALVAADISDETDEEMSDNGPLVTMAMTVMSLQKEMRQWQSHRGAGIGESNPYQGVTWSDSTGWNPAYRISGIGTGHK